MNRHTEFFPGYWWAKKPTFWRRTLFLSSGMISTPRMETAGVHNVGVQCIIGTADTMRTTNNTDC